MSINNRIEKLTALEAAKLQDELMRDFLSSPIDFSLEALAIRSWTAVPVRDQLEEHHEVAIARFAEASGVKKAIAVTTESEIYLEAIRIDLTPLGINAFSANCMLRAFLLVAEDRSFAILEEGDFFFVLAGTEEFLEVALGTSVDQARATFLAYAGKPHWTEGIRKTLLRTHERYRILPPPT